MGEFTRLRIPCYDVASIMTLSFPDLLDLIRSKAIRHTQEGAIEPQPASLDLPLDWSRVHRMPCSILPRPDESISSIVQRESLYRVTRDQLLELGHYYLVPTFVALDLPESISGNANNKSSSGRINLQSRLLLDGVPLFDTIPPGYCGPLWVELHPELAPISLKNPHANLNQIRLREGRHLLSRGDLIAYHEQSPLLYDREGHAVAANELHLGADHQSLNVHVDFFSTHGWKGIRRADLPLELQSHANAAGKFFEPIAAANGRLVVNQNDFYILGSLERVSNPLDVCITMRPFDPTHGEFRSHFAGFFDPGNGSDRSARRPGFVVTMEVIPMESAIQLRHAQPMFAIEIERLRTPCPAEHAYGKARSSHYHGDDGPRLARWFNP